VPELWRQTPQGLQRGGRDLQRIGFLPQRLSREEEQRRREIDSWLGLVGVIVFFGRLVVERLVIVRRLVGFVVVGFGFTTRINSDTIETSGFLHFRRQIAPGSPRSGRTGSVMLNGFKEFILRGNVIDLAVAVVIGAAFTAIVGALVSAVFNPLIGALFNATNLSKTLIVEIPTTSGGSAKLMFGAVIAAVIQFLIVAVVVYFALVVPINYIKKRAFQKKEADEPAVAEDTPPTELELLTDIRDLLANREATRSGSQPSATPGKHTVTP
jgi:large conductance mechanosensitive channel